MFHEDLSYRSVMLSIRQRNLCTSLKTLKTLSVFVQREIERFQREQHDDNAKRQVISGILQIAIEEKVITEKELQESLLVEQSTVNRWKNGDSLPPKKKQVLVLKLVQDSLPKAIEVAERLIEETDRELKTFEKEGYVGAA